MGKFLVFVLSWGLSASAWEVDMTRRQTDLNRMTHQSRQPASIVDETPVAVLKNALTPYEHAQDIVIMNTDEGFVPRAVSVKKGALYKIYVVNVSAKHRNASFILDAFSEHHATAFGRVKSFTITPKADGAYTYQSPESGNEGLLVVKDPQSDRKPANR
jgi:hypothetical protein